MFLDTTESRDAANFSHTQVLHGLDENKGSTFLHLRYMKTFRWNLFTFSAFKYIMIGSYIFHFIVRIAGEL